MEETIKGLRREILRSFQIRVGMCVGTMKIYFQRDVLRMVK